MKKFAIALSLTGLVILTIGCGSKGVSKWQVVKEDQKLAHENNSETSRSEDSALEEVPR